MIEYNQTANGIGLLRIENPERRNAFNWDMQEEFSRLTHTLDTDKDLRVLMITGAGDKAFCTGGDLKQLSKHLNQAGGKQLNATMSNALTRLTRMGVPIIAAVNGDAFGGGCEIVTACDIRVGVSYSRYCFAQVKNGLTTGWGGTSRLVQLIGLSRALDLQLTARIFDAEEAYLLGLLNYVVPADSFNDTVYGLAERLASLPKNALAKTKWLARSALHNPPKKVNEQEAHYFLSLWGKPDHKEAVEAFLEKRPPTFNP